MVGQNLRPNSTSTGHTALRGMYKVVTSTTTMQEDTCDGVRTVVNDEGIPGEHRIQEEEDEWLLSYVLAPPAVSGLCNWLRHHWFGLFDSQVWLMG